MISRFFIERPRFAFVISIVITLAGLISIFTLPVAQYPNITPSLISVTTTYPGADAKTVQETVIQPIEADARGGAPPERDRKGEIQQYAAGDRALFPQRDL